MISHWDRGNITVTLEVAVSRLNQTDAALIHSFQSCYTFTPNKFYPNLLFHHIFLISGIYGGRTLEVEHLVRCMHRYFQ